MAYRTAIDLNYSDLVNFDDDQYRQAGPGALRGIRKAFADPGDYSASDAIAWMVDRQEAEFKPLSLPFSGLFGGSLHAIDCLGLFCELDKYRREAVPSLASNRTRIKARFVATPAPPELSSRRNGALTRAAGFPLVLPSTRSQPYRSAMNVMGRQAVLQMQRSSLLDSTPK